MPILIFIGQVLTELYGKTDNWCQIRKAKEFEFLFIKQSVSQK